MLVLDGRTHDSWKTSVEFQPLPFPGFQIKLAPVSRYSLSGEFTGRSLGGDQHRHSSHHQPRSASGRLHRLPTTHPGRLIARSSWRGTDERRAAFRERTLQWMNKRRVPDARAIGQSANVQVVDLFNSPTNSPDDARWSSRKHIHLSPISAVL